MLVPASTIPMAAVAMTRVEKMVRFIVFLILQIEIGCDADGERASKEWDGEVVCVSTD